MTHGANTPPASEPERLVQGGSDDPVLDELGRWFARAPAPGGIDAAGLARVARRLEGPEGRRRALWRTFALSVALVLGAGGAAAAWGRYGVASRFVSLFARYDATAPPAAHSEPRVRPSRTPSPGRSAAPAGGIVLPNASTATPNGAEAPPSAGGPGPSGGGPGPNAGGPGPSGTPVPNPVVPNADAPAARLVAPNPSAAADEGALARESAALERALTALKRDQDPATALVLLDRYAADFPAGVLRLEAQVARVDANLALGNDAAALALLRNMPLERVGRGLELRLVRAELTAARDCRRANVDFDRVVAAHPPRAFDERALFGRATCREKLGDEAGSRADLATYLARYPTGRFAAAARARSNAPAD